MEKQDFLNILYKRQKEIYDSIKNPDEIKTVEDRIEGLGDSGKLAEVCNLIKIVESMD